MRVFIGIIEWNTLFLVDMNSLFTLKKIIHQVGFNSLPLVQYGTNALVLVGGLEASNCPVHGQE